MPLCKDYAKARGDRFLTSKQITFFHNNSAIFDQIEKAFHSVRRLKACKTQRKRGPLYYIKNGEKMPEIGAEKKRL